MSQTAYATELHFSATLPKKGLKNNGTKYRQYFGETATVKLHGFLATLKKTTIPSEVVTFVDHPNDVFDMYGRMVGDILVSTVGTQVNINQWLAQNGWAFPTFYNSMSETEIQTLASFADSARKAKKGIWQHLSKDVVHPDTSLVYRLPSSKPKPKSEAGHAVMPKLFRRQIRYFVSALNHLVSGSVADFILSQKDPSVKTADFFTIRTLNLPARPAISGSCWTKKVSLPSVRAISFSSRSRQLWLTQKERRSPPGNDDCLKPCFARRG